MTKISIVIPVYNSEKTIESLCEQLVKESQSSFDLEVILVNDGSVDKSGEHCENLVKIYKEIVYLELTRNFGEHNAVLAGLHNCSGEYVVVMDDDLQNPPSEVSKLIEAIQSSDFDVVYGEYLEKKHSLFRNLGSKFNDRIATFLLRKPQGVYLSSFKIMRKGLVQNILKYEGPFPYIDGLILSYTKRIGSVLVKHDERQSGSSGYTLKKLIILWLNMATNFSMMPLRFAAFFGFLLALFSFFFGLLLVYVRLNDPNIAPGWTSVVVLGLFAFSVQLIALGVIGEYLGRALMALNSTPQFAIRNIKNDNH